MRKYTEQEIIGAAKALKICGHCFKDLQAFGQNIAQYIEHPERIVPMSDPNTYSRLAIPCELPLHAISIIPWTNERSQN